MKRLIILILLLLCPVLIILVGDILLIGIPEKDKKTIKAKTANLIRNPDQVEIQPGNECGAYSSAYVRRFWGDTIKGKDLYQTMPTMYNGGILPKHLKGSLRQNGFDVTYRKGSIQSLKQQIDLGQPVIALTRTFENRRYLHYTTIVGYDPDYLYISDSFHPLINSPHKYYNRKISYEDFQKIWKTNFFYMPFYKNTFFTIKKAD